MRIAHLSVNRPLRALATASLLTLLTACGGGGGGSSSSTSGSNGTPGAGAGCADLPLAASNVNGPAWQTFGKDAQRSALSTVASQALNRALWKTPVDLAPQYSGSALLAHYGSPIITSRNTVIIPVKTGATDGFKVEARSGADGSLRWTMSTNYTLPSYRWVPVFQPVLTNSGRLYVPLAGGAVGYLENLDTLRASAVCGGYPSVSFYSASDAPASSVFINTPLTADDAGNIYFGYIVTTAARMTSGIARISATGQGSWVTAASAASDSTITKVAMNSAPAISRDGSTIYVVVTGETQATGGYLLALNSTTLATKARTPLLDPKTNSPAWINENSTASPTVGPDGDVYIGVLEADAPGHNYRGWLLHYNATLTQVKTPGSFGWDTTASIVPTSMIPSYSGPSSYLLMVKYNNYAGVGSGDGKNRVAILDPNVTQIDSISGNPVMREVMTLLAPTVQNASTGAVYEWCINSAAVDPVTRSVLVNNEDGYLYRWDLATNTLTQKAKLDSGLGQAYTPTAIGPDGVVYAINNALLFAVGQ